MSPLHGICVFVAVLCVCAAQQASTPPPPPSAGDQGGAIKGLLHALFQGSNDNNRVPIAQIVNMLRQMMQVSKINYVNENKMTYVIGRGMLVTYNGN